jgi:hypothetical protein
MGVHPPVSRHCSSACRTIFAVGIILTNPGPMSRDIFVIEKKPSGKLK